MSDRGVVLVATGERYRAILPRAAAYARRACPGLEIEAFADAPIENAGVDHLVILDDPWIRSKLDALARTRFERALYIDVDALIVADLSDGFTLLDRFDLALAQEQCRAAPWALEQVGPRLPNAFPQFNSGVIFIRRNARTAAFVAAWRRRLAETGAQRDQPDLRALAWETDCRIATLPDEYNLHLRPLVRRASRAAAPRVIHTPRFHKAAAFRTAPWPVLLYLGPSVFANLLDRLDADRTLPGRPRPRDRSALARLRRFVVLRWLYLRMKVGLERRSRSGSGPVDDAPAF